MTGGMAPSVARRPLPLSGVVGPWLCAPRPPGVCLYRRTGREIPVSGFCPSPRRTNYPSIALRSESKSWRTVMERTLRGPRGGNSSGAGR